MTVPTISIVRVEPIRGYQLRLTFDDRTHRVVDFGPFLEASVHPDLRRWLEPGAFASYRLEHGDLVWGDWELCFPIADLYHGIV